MGKGQTVFLVLAIHDYEGNDAVCVFANEDEADAFVTKCREYEGTKPESPPLEETPENDALHAAWHAKYEAWAKAHPAGEDHASADSFKVKPVTLIGSTGQSGKRKPEGAEGKWKW